MVFGMATTKITITLPDDQIHSIRELVAAGKAGSVSAFVKHAVAVGSVRCGGVAGDAGRRAAADRRVPDERGAQDGRMHFFIRRKESRKEKG
jgi:Arc/MetJ-type ribon-helix-helix transcriptional regulator